MQDNTGKNSKPKVAIVLSTYNGEKYLRELLESLLNQTYPNIKIYIRDDGSKDRTKEILREYCKKKNIELFFGENVGFVNSFFSLLKKCTDEEYFFFCDQDDIWLPDKVQNAVEVLKQRKNNIPILYFCNYDFYDSNMNFIGHNKVNPSLLGFENSLFDSVVFGFSVAINRKCYDMLIEKTPKHSCSHDMYAYLLSTAFGEVVFDERIGVKYRRHSGNVSPSGMGFLRLQIWRIKNIYLNDYFSKVKSQLKEFENLYKDDLDIGKSRMLKLFTEDKFNIKSYLIKIFYPKRFRQKLPDELFLRAMFVLKKL